MIYKSWTPRVLCGVFAFFILLEFIWGLHTYFSPAFNTMPMQPQKQMPKEVPVAREEILKYPLFGDFLPQDLAGVAVKDSTLHVQLIGIIFSPNEKNSEAVLQMQNGEQKIFHVGDTIPGGAIIRRITEQKVYMGRNGTIEYLFLPEKDINFEPPPPPLF